MWHSAVAWPSRSALSCIYGADFLRPGCHVFQLAGVNIFACTIAAQPPASAAGPARQRLTSPPPVSKHSSAPPSMLWDLAPNEAAGPPAGTTAELAGGPKAPVALPKQPPSVRRQQLPAATSRPGSGLSSAPRSQPRPRKIPLARPPSRTSPAADQSHGTLPRAALDKKPALPPAHSLHRLAPDSRTPRPHLQGSSESAVPPHPGNRSMPSSRNEPSSSPQAFGLPKALPPRNDAASGLHTSTPTVLQLSERLHE